MRQQWRDLLFLHWPIPASLLRPLIPSELTVDTFEGQAYVGLVPFTMRNVRPSGLPAFAPLSNFHEINVRTYVHHDGGNPGVWFFSLDAANTVAVRIARAWFKLPYFYARMSLNREQIMQTLLPSGQQATSDKQQTTSQERTGNEIGIDYASERIWPSPVPAKAHLRWTPTGAVTQAPVDTLDHFLVERYLLYSYKNKRLYRGQVHHAAYPLQTANVTCLDENLVAQAGIARPDTPPIIHYARGVDVDIYPLREVKAQR